MSPELAALLQMLTTVRLHVVRFLSNWQGLARAAVFTGAVISLPVVLWDKDWRSVYLVVCMLWTTWEFRR
jgi:hypothetical protein